MIQFNLPTGTFQVHPERPQGDFLEVLQVHGAKILSNPTPTSEADGILWNDHRVAGLKTADCLPLYLRGENHYLIHAGWRGLHQGILKNPEILSLSYAFIGPHICPFHYEVGPEFKQHFPNNPALKIDQKKLSFSLAEEAKAQLTERFPQIEIQEAGLCTFEEESLKSFRAGDQKARNWNIFIPQ